MTRVHALAVLGLLAIALVAGISAAFIVPQTEQALVLQFGETRRLVTAPGLHFKAPFIQNVVLYDKRLLDLLPSKQQVILADQKRIDVDAYGQYRIVDPLRFFQKLNNEQQARRQLGETFMISAIRRVLGSKTLGDMLSLQRDQIQADILREVNDQAKAYGVEVVDVRLRRADLPEQTSKAIYSRMKSERDREANLARAEGQRQATEIRSRADYQQAVTLAEARSKSQQIRGAGDAQATQIYAEAFTQDPNFFSFYRSMSAYRESLGSGDSTTTLLLSPDTPFLRYLEAPFDAAPPAAGRAPETGAKPGASTVGALPAAPARP